MGLRTHLAASAAVILSCLGASAAQAAALVTFTEVGPDVVVALTGQINTSGLGTATPTNAAFSFIAILPSSGAFQFFGDTEEGLGFGGPLFASEPSSYGTGTGSFAIPGNWTGSNFQLISRADNPNRLFVPKSNVSTIPLAGTGSFLGQSFSSLGVTPGTYVWTLKNQDTVTLRIGAIPEPSTWMMMILGFGLIAQQLRRRIRAVV